MGSWRIVFTHNGILSACSSGHIASFADASRDAFDLKEQKPKQKK